MREFREEVSGGGAIAIASASRDKIDMRYVGSLMRAPRFKLVWRRDGLRAPAS